MQKLLIATGNQGKVKEFQILLAGRFDARISVQLLTPKDIGLDLEVVEDGKNYEENAGKKALAYSKASGLISLADDSGLEVDALNGAPGLYSARYSQESIAHAETGAYPGMASPLPTARATDADRRACLLKNLDGKPRPWKAHFHATIAVGYLCDARWQNISQESIGMVSQESTARVGTGAYPGMVAQVFYAEGNCYGEIIPDERGDNGFGYDPIFFIPEMNCTMAELSMQAKNRLSHRALALENTLPFLQKILMDDFLSKS